MIKINIYFLKSAISIQPDLSVPAECDEFLDLTYPEYKGSNETEKVIDCKRRLGIVGGYLALPGNYPHMALLGYDSGAGGGELEWNCGGSIISLRFILTAAHCIHTSR